MKQIEFNVLPNAFLKGGKSCNVKDIHEIINVNVTSKTEQPCLQIFNSGYRVTSENINWNYWNGCVFVDIDSKHYYNEVKKFNIDKIYDELYNQLIYIENFYNIHKSWSGTSYHIIFYFDVEKNETNFKKCCQYAREITFDCFSNIGCEQILKYNNVLDKCTVSQYQCMFLNTLSSKYYIYGDVLGSWDWIDKYELKQKYELKINDVNEDRTINFIYDGKKETTIKNKIEAHHKDRMSIYMSLISVFNNRETVNKEWERICCNYIECPNYTPKKMYYDAIKNNWFDKYDKYTHFVNSDILKPFGYKLHKKFIPTINKVNYKEDYIVNLDSDEYLADIDMTKYLKEDKINHIFAGCGFGKTYWAKKLAENNRVCFISPLTSIISDSFEDDNNFVIIDSKHNEENKHMFNGIRDIVCDSYRSICTTWESFVIYKMYNKYFDYIIIDEIHTLYMYKYRIDSIFNIKKYFKESTAKYKILMTGTPSLELKEFDCNKIKIIKEQPKTKCEIVGYENNIKGYIINDIKEWTKEDNHYAVIFKDTANYKDVESYELEGIEAFIFNSNYVENVEEMIDTKTLTNKVNIISVYGQAGINIHTDDNQKVRLYIQNYNGLAAIQYANRIRNKKSIDKVVIPVKKDIISNDIKELHLYDDKEKELLRKNANKKIDIINSMLRNKDRNDIYSDIEDKIQKFICYFGLYNFIEKIDYKYYVLKDTDYLIYKQMMEVNEYENQMQVLYNRLIDNYFDVEVKYLDNDIKTNKETKNRSNQFSGAIMRFDMDKVKRNYDTNKLYIDVNNNNIRHYLTGNLKDVIEGILNLLDKNNEGKYKSFINIIVNVIKDKGSITKNDINHIYNIINLNYKWNKYFDNGFIYVMRDNSWNDCKITAALVRSMYNNINKEQWKEMADEMYEEIHNVRNTLDYIKYVDGIIDIELENPNKLIVENDNITSTIYTYLVENHTRGKKGGKKGKQIIIKGVTYNTVSDAAEALGVSRKTIYKWMKEDKI